MRWSQGIMVGKFAALWLMTCVACAAIYPEVNTPILPPPNDDAVKPPPPDNYVCVYLKGARIPAQMRDGRKWGKDEGYPSPYAILSLDGNELSRTEVEPDTLEPTWPNQKKSNYKIVGKSRLKIEIWDNHGLIPHPLCVREVLNVQGYADVGETELDCGGGTIMTLAVEPAHARWGLGFFYELRSSAASVTRVIAASAAGRVGLSPGDEIVSIMGHATSQLDTGQVQSLIRSNSTTGLKLKVSTGGGAPREVTLKDEAIYPLAEDKIPLN